MEERIIDDEYGRGIRLKKTKDGYVDAVEDTGEEVAEEETDEVLFEFPDFGDKDDEELATLTPEQAEELKKKRAEEEKKREAEYLALVDEGNSLLAEEKFAEAEEVFEKAEPMQTNNSKATFGLFLAKTQNVKDLDGFVKEYYDGKATFDDFKYEYGNETVQKIKTEYNNIIEEKKAETEQEIAPLKEEYEEKSKKRRDVLLKRKKSAVIGFFASAIPMAIFLALGITFATLITSSVENNYAYFAIGAGALFVISFIVVVPMANKLLNIDRLIKKNNTLTSTTEGKKLSYLYYAVKFYDNLSK